MVSVVEAKYNSLLCLEIQITPTVGYLALTATLKRFMSGHNVEDGNCESHQG
jgi:hypothetical protein